ncbi:hypothetical protein NQ315_014686 [Exocentrus adspersus]|uniref:Uncharacterized protein n=1 Tax=Exocentrus adspersus TaxID=1586481 RepID=A0AAV8VQB6_9CUCU|nr:hypothetical protein NQ315_014686 [Exocentrus adspersus]
MTNMCGPGQTKRKMLWAAVQSIILYAAPLWTQVLNVASYREQLVRVQRQMAIRICRSYRTVSNEAVVVVAGTIPLYLLVAERLRIDNSDRTAETKKNERTRTLNRWQCEWNTANKGRWELWRRNMVGVTETEITGENVMDVMIRSKDDWNAVVSFMTRVITKKEQDERRE